MPGERGNDRVAMGNAGCRHVKYIARSYVRAAIENLLGNDLRHGLHHDFTALQQDRSRWYVGHMRTNDEVNLSDVVEDNLLKSRPVTTIVGR